MDGPLAPWLLSSTDPSGAHRRLAAAVALLSLLFCAALAPFAGTPLTPVPAFLPIYESALVVCDLVTTVLLFGQFTIAGSRGLLLLAAAYLFGALMATAHALSFPGLFGPAGWIGDGPQTTAWLYFLWHAGFPLFILGYARAGSHARSTANPPQSPAAAIAAGVALAVVPAAVLIALATAGHGVLPPIMAGDRDAPLKALVAAATWLFALAALVQLWRRSTRSVLDLWLMVVLCAWMADSALAAVFNHARYDMGWYAGRVFGLLASAFVLAVLLLENGALHARLAQAHRALGEANAQLEIVNRDLDRFVGAVAHDLQQPILSISGYAQQVHRHAQREQQVRPGDLASLQRIIAIAANADRMVQDLLQFARLGQRELELEDVDLNRVVDEVRATLAREIESNGVQLQVAPLPQVRGDASLLAMALVNLLSNAIKYSRGREPPVVHVDAPVEADGAAVRVRDNGVGFDMAHAARLFTPFERLHSAKDFEGTGMGLANVRRIMERHGGSIRAESSPGAGASFLLVFPRGA